MSTNINPTTANQPVTGEAAVSNEEVSAPLSPQDADLPVDTPPAVHQQMLDLMKMLADTQKMQVTSTRNTGSVDRDATNVVKFSGDGGVMPQTFIRDCELVCC